MNDEIEELRGRVAALQCVLRVLLSELGRNVPARQKVIDAMRELDKDIEYEHPVGSRLLAFRQARADMQLPP